GGGFEDDANIPMDIVEDDQPVGEPQPDGVPMELDSLVGEYQEQLEDRFLALEQSSSGGRWIEVDLCGQVVKQQIGNGLRCETSGVLLDPFEAEKGFRKEYEQLGKLKVGKVVSETVAHSKSEKAKQRIVGLYAPTSSIEALRFFLALIHVVKGALFSVDISTAFLYASLEGFIIAVIIYVDDLLIGGPLKFCREIIQQMCQRFETKLTGEIHAGACGELEFLGRKIVRREKMGGFFLGLPGSYFDKIEQTSGLSLKVASVAPEMAKFVEEKESAVLLAKAEAEKYRFAKGFRGFYQEIPGSEVGSFDYGTEKLTAVIDASWNTKSVAGGFILWGSAMIKAWSRRISTTCLSSAEAELHALVEGLRELLGTSTVVETCLKGLLRKVRHMELRVAILQEYVQSGRLEVIFVEHQVEIPKIVDNLGALSAANRKKVEDGISKAAEKFVKESDYWVVEMDRVVKVHRQARKKLLDPRHDVSLPVDVAEISGGERLTEIVFGEKEREIRDNWVFGDLVEEDLQVLWTGQTTFFKSRHNEMKFLKVAVVAEDFVKVKDLDGELTEEINQMRAIPKRWDSYIKRNAPLQLLLPNLQEFCRGGKILVIEVCCREDSAIAVECKRFGYSYLGLHAGVDVREVCVGTLMLKVLEKEWPVSCDLFEESTYLRTASGWNIIYEQKIHR
ncbi:unnamed protein product, partial [Effrenium voratum]